MSTADDEIKTLREQVRFLTQRVYAAEQRLAALEHPHEPEFIGDPGNHPNKPEFVGDPGLEHASSQPGVNTSAVAYPPGQLPTALPMAALPPPPIAPAELTRPETLESRIGSRWLNRIGIVAVLVGVSYFLKFAFENNWVGPAARVLIGIVCGIAVGVWSERFRRQGFAGFAHSLKAVAAGVLYLSLWASCQLYDLVPATAAFLAMLLVTAAASWLALRQNAEVLAALALVGGFLTPVLVSTGENREAALFSYVLLLDVGALLLQRVRLWPRILVGSFVGTELLFVFWYTKFYSNDQFSQTVLFASAFFALFAGAPLLAKLSPAGATPAAVPAMHIAQGAQRTPAYWGMGAVLPVLNAFAYFCVLFAMLNAQGVRVEERVAPYVFVMAALYGGLGLALDRRVSGAMENSTTRSFFTIESGRLLPLVHFGLAAACLTAAIGLWLEGHWIALTWLIEALALFYAGARAERPPVRWFGAAVAVLGVGNLLIESFHWRTGTLGWNERFGLYLLAIAVIGAMVWLSVGEAQPDERQRLRERLRTSPLVAVAVIAINLLALCALNLEVGDYFRREIAFVRDAYRSLSPVMLAQQMRSLAIVRDFTYSAVWMAYGVTLICVGFWRRSEFLRWQAMVLIGVTIVKVFVFDVSALDRIYRILSFMILGIILLAISFAYQKNWLTKIED